MMRADGLNLIDSRGLRHSFVISRPKALMKRIGVGGCVGRVICKKGTNWNIAVSGTAILQFVTRDLRLSEDHF